MSDQLLITARVTNELLEQLCRTELSGRQYRVFLAVIRKTYGFNRKAGWITAEQLREIMGYEGNCTHICADLRELKNRKLIIQNGKRTGTIGPNPTLSEWVLDKPKQPKKSSKDTESDQKRSLQKTKDTTPKSIAKTPRATKAQGVTEAAAMEGEL